jgi:hypothetical protein
MARLLSQAVYIFKIRLLIHDIESVALWAFSWIQPIILYLRISLLIKISSSILLSFLLFYTRYPEASVQCFANKTQPKRLGVGYVFNSVLARVVKHRFKKKDINMKEEKASRVDKSYTSIVYEISYITNTQSRNCIAYKFLAQFLHRPYSKFSNKKSSQEYLWACSSIHTRP